MRHVSIAIQIEVFKNLKLSCSPHEYLLFELYKQVSYMLMVFKIRCNSTHSLHFCRRVFPHFGLQNIKSFQVIHENMIDDVLSVGVAIH